MSVKKEQQPEEVNPQAQAEERAKLEQLERAVYGKPLIVHTEPSIGTEDTPPPTEEVLPIHPGGITKQGDDMEKEPHLPRVIPVHRRARKSANKTRASRTK